jgi:hypothetical protein
MVLCCNFDEQIADAPAELRNIWRDHADTALSYLADIKSFLAEA